MADVELLPLPPLYIVPSVEPVDYPDVAQALMDYARANVAHATAPLQAEIERLRADVEALRNALVELITWIPSADTYRRLGFDPEAPMRAYKEAKAALSKEATR